MFSVVIEVVLPSRLLRQSSSTSPQNLMAISRAFLKNSFFVYSGTSNLK